MLSQEAKLNAVERVLEYKKLPPEPQTVMEKDAKDAKDGRAGCYLCLCVHLLNSIPCETFRCCCVVVCSVV